MLGDERAFDEVMTARMENAKATTVTTAEPKTHKTYDDIKAALIAAQAQAHARVEPTKERLEDLLRRQPSTAVDEAIATKLGSTPRWVLHPKLVAELWQRRAVRTAIATAWMKSARCFGASLDAVAQIGLPLDGFVEAATVAMLAHSPAQVLYCETLDQLREVLAIAIRDGEPAKVAELYLELNDVPAVDVFLRAFDREPLDHRTAIRAAMTFDDDDDRHVALKGWIEKPRKKRANQLS